MPLLWNHVRGQRDVGIGPPKGIPPWMQAQPHTVHSPPYIGDGLAAAPFYWACGLECNNLGHFGSNIQNAPTIVTSGQRTGTRAVQIAATAAQEYALVPFLNTTIRKTVASFYVKFNSLAGTIHEVIMVRTAASNSARIYYDPTGTKLTASFSAGTTSSSGAVTTGVWYLIDILVDTTSGTSTMDWYLDGVYIGQATNVQAAHDQLGVRFGSFVSVTVDFLEDDLVLSQRAADFPIGPHTVDLYQGYEVVTRITAQTLTPGVASLVLSSLAPTVTASDNKVVTPGVTALATAAFAPTVTGGSGVVVTPGVASLTVTRLTPTVLAPRLVTPGVSALVLTPFAPSALAPRLVTPGVAALTVTRLTPTVLAPRLVVPGVRALTLTPLTPVVSAGVRAVPGVVGLILSPLAPTVAATDNKVATPGVAALSTTRFAPTVLTPRLAVPGLRSLVLTRFTPTVTATAAVVVVPGLRVLGITRFPPLVFGVDFRGTVGAVWILRDQAGAALVGAQASVGATSIARDSVGVTFVLRDSVGATASARDSVGASLV